MQLVLRGNSKYVPKLTPEQVASVTKQSLERILQSPDIAQNIKKRIREILQTTLRNVNRSVLSNEQWLRGKNVVDLNAFKKRAKQIKAILQSKNMSVPDIINNQSSF